MDFSFRYFFPAFRCSLSLCVFGVSRLLFNFSVCNKTKLACGCVCCWRVINWMTWLAKCNNIYDPRKGCSREGLVRLLLKWERERKSRESFISFSSTSHPPPTTLFSHFNAIMISLYELFMRWKYDERNWCVFNVKMSEGKLSIAIVDDT